MLVLGKARKVVSLDWDWRTLRVAHARVSGSKVKVLSLVSRPLEAGLAYGDPRGLGAFIRRVLSEERISTRLAIVDIPRDQAVLNFLSLPAAGVSELAGLVRFQIMRELAFPIDEAVVDFAADPPDEINEQRILVGAVRHDILEFYRQVVNFAGLKLDRIGLRPYANLVALAHEDRELSSRRTMFVDVGPTLSEIDILVDGRLAFSRAASVNVIPRAEDRTQADATGSGAPSEPPATAVFLKTNHEQIVQNLMVDITRTLEAFRATDPVGSVDRVVIAGSCGVEADLARSLETRLKVPCRLYGAGDELAQRLGHRGNMTPFVATLGLVLSQADRTKSHFDFLHPKEPEAAKRERAKRIPQIAATIALAILAGGAFFWNVNIKPKRERLAFLTAQASKLKPEAEKIDKFRKLTEELVSWEKNEAVWIDEMYRLVEVLPENKDAYLTSLSLKDPGKLSIKLVARDNQIANEIANKMAELKTESGKPLYTTRTGSTRKGKDVKYPFSTEVTIEPYQEPDRKDKHRRS